MESSINKFCCYFVLTYSLLPILSVFQSNIFFEIVYVAAILLWIVTGLTRLTSFYRKKMLLPYAVFITVVILYMIVGYGNLNLATAICYALLFGIALNGCLYITKPNKKFDKNLFNYLTFLYLITLVTTIGVLSTDGLAARTLTSSSSDSDAIHYYQLKNVGSFDFIYSLLLLIPLVGSFIKASFFKSRVKSLFFVGFLLLMVICIIMSNFTTALILLFLDIMLLLLIGREKMTFSKFFFISMIVMVLAPAMLIIFIQQMVGLTDSIYAADKLTGLLAVSAGSEDVGEVYTRTDLIQASINSFFSNPIIGVGGWYPIYGVPSPKIGYHSQFIDEFARYGLIGAGPLLLFFRNIFSIIYKQNGHREFYKNIVFVPLLIFTILSFLNPVFANILMISIFIYVPLIDRSIRYENTIYS